MPNITISNGRLMMIILTTIGTLPIFLNPSILSATTISGTMVIGLAPIFLFWKLSAPKLSYYASIFTGLMWGILLVGNLIPTQFYFTSGKYADLLTANILGSICCIFAFLLPYFFRKMTTPNDY